MPNLYRYSPTNSEIAFSSKWNAVSNSWRRQEEKLQIRISEDGYVHVEILTRGVAARVLGGFSKALNLSKMEEIGVRTRECYAFKKGTMNKEEVIARIRKIFQDHGIADVSLLKNSLIETLVIPQQAAEEIKSLGPEAEILESKEPLSEIFSKTIPDMSLAEEGQEALPASLGVTSEKTSISRQVEPQSSASAVVKNASAKLLKKPQPVSDENQQELTQDENEIKDYLNLLKMRLQEGVIPPEAIFKHQQQLNEYDKKLKGSSLLVPPLHEMKLLLANLPLMQSASHEPLSLKERLAEIDYALTHMGVPENEREVYTPWMKGSKLHKVVDYAWDKFMALDLKSDSIAVEDQADLALMAQWYSKLKNYHRELNAISEVVAGDEELQDEIWLQNRRIDQALKKFDWLSLYFTECEKAEKMLLAANDQLYEQLVNEKGELFLSTGHLKQLIAQITVFMELSSKYSGPNEQWKALIEKKCQWQINELMRGIEDFAEAILLEMQAEIRESVEHLKEIRQVIRANKGTFFENLQNFYKNSLCLTNIEKSSKEYDQFFQQVLLGEGTKTSGFLSTLKKFFQESFIKKEFPLEIRERLTHVAERFKSNRKELEKAHEGAESKLCHLKLFFSYGKLNRKELLSNLENNSPEMLMALKFLADRIDPSESDSAFYLELKEVGKKASELLAADHQLSHKQEIEHAQEQVLQIIKKLTTTQLPKEDADEVNSQLQAAEAHLEEVLKQTPIQQEEKQTALLAIDTRAKRRVLTRSKKEMLKQRKAALYEAPDRPILGIVYFLMNNFASLIQANMAQLQDAINANKPAFGVTNALVSTVVRPSFSSSTQAMVSTHGGKDYVHHKGMAETFAETDHELKFVKLLDNFLKGERSGDFQGGDIEEFSEAQSLSTINRWGWMHTRAYPGMLEEHFAAELQHFSDNPPKKVKREQLTQRHALYDMYRHVGDAELFETACVEAREYGETAYVDKFKEYLEKRYAVLNPEVPLDSISLDTVLNGKTMLSRLANEANVFKVQLERKELSQLVLSVQRSEITRFHENLTTLLKNSVTELDPKSKRSAWLANVSQARDQLQEIKNIPQTFARFFTDPVETLLATNEMAGRVLLQRINVETHSLEELVNSGKEIVKEVKEEQQGLIKKYEQKLEDVIQGNTHIPKKKNWIDSLQEAVDGNTLDRQVEFLQTLRDIQQEFLVLKKNIEDVPKAFLHKEAISVAKFEVLLNRMVKLGNIDEEILGDVLGDNFLKGKEYPSDPLKILQFLLDVISNDLDILRKNAWCTSEMLSDVCRAYFDNSYLKKMMDHPPSENSVSFIQTIRSYLSFHVNDLDKKLLEEPDYLLTYLEKAKATIETALKYERKFKFVEDWPFFGKLFFPVLERDLMALPEGESMLFFDSKKGLIYEAEKQPESVRLEFKEYGEQEVFELQGQSQANWNKKSFYEEDLGYSIAWEKREGLGIGSIRNRIPQNYAAKAIRKTNFRLRVYDANKNFDKVLEVEDIPGFDADKRIYYGNLLGRTSEWLSSFDADWGETDFSRLIYNLRISDEVPQSSIYDLASYIADSLNTDVYNSGNKIKIEFPNISQDYQPILAQNAPFQFLMSTLGVVSPQKEWETYSNSLEEKRRNEEIENLEKLIALGIDQQVSSSEINQLRKAKDDLIKIKTAINIQKKLVQGFQPQKNRLTLLSQCVALISFHEKHKEFYAEEEAWRNLALKAGSELASKLPEYRALGVINDKLMEYILQRVQEVKNEVEKAARNAGIIVLKSKSQNLIKSEKAFVSNEISPNSLPIKAPKGMSDVPEVYRHYSILEADWHSQKTLQDNALRFFNELALAKSASDTEAVIEGLRHFIAGATTHIDIESLDQENFINAFSLFSQLSNEYVLALEKFVGSKPITIEQILPQLQIITLIDRLQQHVLFPRALHQYSDHQDITQFVSSSVKNPLNYEDSGADAPKEIFVENNVPVFDELVKDNILNREFFTLNVKYAAQFKQIKDHWTKKKIPAKALREVLKPLLDKIKPKNASSKIDKTKVEIDEDVVDQVLLPLRDVALGTHRLCYNYKYKLDIEKNAQIILGTATSIPQLKLFEDPVTLDQTDVANQVSSRLESHQPFQVIPSDEVRHKAAKVAQVMPNISMHILAQEFEINSSPSGRAAKAISFGKAYPEFLAEEAYQQKFFRWIFEGHSFDEALLGAPEVIERFAKNINTFFQTAYTRHHNLQDFKTVSFILLLGQFIKDRIEAKALELGGMQKLMGNYLPEFLWNTGRQTSEKSVSFRDKWIRMQALPLPQEVKGILWRDLAYSYINAKSLSGAEAAQFMIAVLNYKFLNVFADWRHSRAEHEIEEFIKSNSHLFHEVLQKNGKENFDNILNTVYQSRFPQASKLIWDIQSTYPLFVDESRSVEIDLKTGEIRLMGQQTIEMPMSILKDPQFIEIFGTATELPITKAPADPLLPGSQIYILNHKRNYRIIKSPNEPLVIQAEFGKRWHQLLKQDEDDRLNFSLEAPFKSYRKWYAFNPMSVMLEDHFSKEIFYRAFGEPMLKIEALNNEVPTGFFVVQPTENIIRVISPFEDVRQLIILKDERESSLAKIILPRYGFEFIANNGELVWIEDFTNLFYRANVNEYLAKLKESKEYYSLAKDLDKRGITFPVPSDNFLALERKLEDNSVGYKLIFPIAPLLQTSDFLRSETEVDYESTLMDFDSPSELYVQYEVPSDLSQLIPKNLNSKLYLSLLNVWKHGELDFANKAYQLLASAISLPTELSPSRQHILHMIVNTLQKTRIYQPQAVAVRLKAAVMILHRIFDAEIGIVKTISLNKKQLLDDYLLYREHPEAVTTTPLKIDEEVLLFMAFRDELDMIGNNRHRLIWKRFEKEGVLDYFVNLKMSDNPWKTASGQLGKMTEPSVIYPWRNGYFNFDAQYKFLLSELTMDVFYPKTTSDLLATPEFQQKYAITRKYALAVKEWEKARNKYYTELGWSSIDANHFSVFRNVLPFPGWFENDFERANLIKAVKKVYSYSAFWPMYADLAWMTNELNAEIKQTTSLEQAKGAYLLMAVIDKPENFAEDLAPLVNLANQEGRKLFSRQIIAPMRAAATERSSLTVGELNEVDVYNIRRELKVQPKGVLREYDDFLSNVNEKDKQNAYKTYLLRIGQRPLKLSSSLHDMGEISKDYYHYLEKIYPQDPRNIQAFRKYLQTAKGMSEIEVTRYTHILDNERVPLPPELTFEIPSFLKALPISEKDRAQKADIVKTMKDIVNSDGNLDAAVKKILRAEQKATESYQAIDIPINYEVVSLEALNNALTVVKVKLAELQTSANKLSLAAINKANEIPTEAFLLDKARELGSQKVVETYVSLTFKYAKAQLGPELTLMMRDSLAVGNEVNYLQSLVNAIEKAKNFELSEDTSALAKLRKAQHLKELALELSRKVVYDVDKFHAFAVIENLLGIRIRAEQLDLFYKLKIVNGIITNPAFLNRALEAIMGTGKSFLIAPLFSFLNADGKHLAIVIAPEKLLPDMMTDLKKSLGGALDGIIEEMTLTRKTQLDATTLERILNRLQGCRTGQKTLVISIQSLFTLWLKWHEGREDPANIITDFEDRLYAKIFSEIFTYGSALLDEVDLLLNINTRQLFAMGRGIKGGLDTVYKDVIKDIFTYLASGVGKSREILGALKDTKNRYQIEKSEFVSEILDNQLKISDPAWKPFYETFSKNVEQRDFIRMFLLGKDGSPDDSPITPKARKAVEDYVEGLAPKIRDILSILKEEINTLLPATVPQKLFTTYGPNPVSFNKTSDDDQRFAIIPWNLGNPAPNGTKFQPVETMNLDYVEALDNYINPDQNLGGINSNRVRAFVKHIRKSLREDMAKHPNKPLEEQESYKLYEYIVGADRIDELPINALDDDDVDKIVEIINQDAEKIIYMVDEFAHKNLEIFPVQLVADPLLVGSLVGNIQGMTGTVEHNVETFTETITDYQVSNASLEATAVSLKRKDEKVPSVQLPDVRSRENIIGFFKANVPAEPCSIIDTGNFLGGLKDVSKEEADNLKKGTLEIKSILTDSSTTTFGTKSPLNAFQVAEIYLDVVQEKQLAKFEKIWTTEVVIHDVHGAWVVSKIPEDAEDPSGLKVVNIKPFTEGKVLNEGRSVIYLQFKTTGTDIKLLDTMQAVVTISKDMKLRDLHQGIYRLRLIAQQQSVTYLTSPESANYIAKALQEIDGANFTRGQTDDNPLIAQDYMRYLLIHQAQKRAQDNVKAFKLKLKNKVLNVILKEMLDTESSVLMQIPVVRSLVRIEEKASPYELFGKSASKLDKEKAVLIEVKKMRQLLSDIINVVSSPLNSSEFELWEVINEKSLEGAKTIETWERDKQQMLKNPTAWQVQKKVDKYLSESMLPEALKKLKLLDKKLQIKTIKKHLKVRMSEEGIKRLKALKEELQTFAKGQLAILPDQIESESNYGAQMQVQTQTQQETKTQTQQSTQTQTQMQMRTTVQMETLMDNKFPLLKDVIKIPWRPWPTKGIFKARYYEPIHRSIVLWDTPSEYIHAFQDLPLDTNGIEKTFSPEILSSNNLYPVSTGITGRSLSTPNQRKEFSYILLVQSNDGPIKKIMLDRDDVEHWREVIMMSSQGDIDGRIVKASEVHFGLFDLNDGLKEQSHVYDDNRFIMENLIKNKAFMADWAYLKIIQGDLKFQGKAAGCDYNLLSHVKEWIEKVGAKPAEEFFLRMLELRGMGPEDPYYLNSDIGRYFESLKPKV